jgi:hypothetical protein
MTVLTESGVTGWCYAIADNPNTLAADGLSFIASD